MHEPISNSTHSDYRRFYAPIQTEMEHVETLLKSFLECENPFISQVVHHGFQLGGKRMRPALLLLFARMAGEVLPEHEILAAAVETIHASSLVHDDVLDEADMRRHLPTVNAEWNNETSVLLGDFMIARAIRQVIALKQPDYNDLIASVCCRLCEGEMRQVGFRGCFTLTEEQYRSIISDKTAALCEIACALGVHRVAGISEKQKQAAQAFGHGLGMAFQIVDDMLDLFGDEALTGKSLGTDLQKQKLTLPLIRLLAALDEERRGDLIQQIQTNAGEELRLALRDRFDEFHIRESVRATADEYLNGAIHALDAFADCDAKDSLVGIARFVLTRKL